MNFKPLVSVIIPTYNRRNIVTDAIDSVLHQDYPNIEIIVVDDGSTDGTTQQIQKTYGNKILQLFQDHSEKSKARNYGIIESDGELVCTLDSDDILLPHALKNMVECFNTNPHKPSGGCCLRAFYN